MGVVAETCVRVAHEWAGDPLLTFSKDVGGDRRRGGRLTGDRVVVDIGAGVEASQRHGLVRASVARVEPPRLAPFRY